MLIVRLLWALALFDGVQGWRFRSLEGVMKPIRELGRADPKPTVLPPVDSIKSAYLLELIVRDVSPP
jgi:hypothetical protein